MGVLDDIGDFFDDIDDVVESAGRKIGREIESTARSVGRKARHAVRSMKEGSRRIAEFLGFGGITGPSEHTRRQRERLYEAMRPRRPATLDEARMRQLESDRLLRRRGVLANIYGGAAESAPLVGTKTLLGE